MAYTIWQCDYEIGKLNNALNQISYIRSYLANFISNVDTEINKLSNSYLVNGDPTRSVGRLVSLKKDANETSNYLKNTIVPGINTTINNLKRKRQELEKEASQ